jgi:hypothetical protein
MQVMGFLLGKCRSFNSSPPRKDHHHASRDSRVDVDYMISVINHIPRGNECCYGRYLWYPAGKVRFRTSLDIAREGFARLPFSLDGVFFVLAVQSGCLPPCSSGSRNSWHGAAWLIHVARPSPGPRALTRETWQGGVVPVLCPSRWTKRSNPGRCTRPNHHIRMLHDTFLQTGQARRK